MHVPVCALVSTRVSVSSQHQLPQMGASNPWHWFSSTGSVAYAFPMGGDFRQFLVVTTEGVLLALVGRGPEYC